MFFWQLVVVKEWFELAHDLPHGDGVDRVWHLAAALQTHRAVAAALWHTAVNN